MTAYTWRAVLGVLSVVGSIASIAAFLYMMLAGIELSGAARSAVPAFLSMIFFACIGYLIYIALYMRQRAEMHHHRANLYRRFLSDLNGISAVRLVLLRHVIDAVDGYPRMDTTSNQLEQFLDHTSDLFTRQTGDECAVCIKMIEEKGGTQFVRTLARDSASMRARQRTDSDYPAYRVWENTAFDELIKKNMERFLSNDLGEEPRYFNANVRWREFYNACLVVPIAPSSMDDEVVGFLCVDNLHGNFQEDVSVPLASQLAKGLFEMFYIDATLQSRSLRERGTGENDG